MIRTMTDLGVVCYYFSADTYKCWAHSVETDFKEIPFEHIPEYELFDFFNDMVRDVEQMYQKNVPISALAELQSFLKKQFFFEEMQQDEN